MLVHENALVRNHPEVPLDRATLVGCVGLATVNGAALAGAERIIAIDRLPQKLELAKQMGATDTILVGNDDPVQQVRDLTGGGVHYSFEALGLKQTAEQSFYMLRPGGTATIIGMIPFGTKIELHGFDFLRERKVQGSSMGSNRFRVDMPRLLGLWRQGRLHLDHLITGTLRLDEINQGFARLKTGEVVRQLIAF
jgi:S-(hydroxymethyl)glutathione dehydrogenase/alcohol dehydrogenase